MSIRTLISDFKKKVTKNKYENFVSDDQRREWLNQALQALSDARPIENHHSIVNIIADDENVILPRDYRTADEVALLAVEYGFSEQFAIQSGVNLDFYNYRISRPIAGYNTKLRYLQPTAKPRVTEEAIYGVSRKVLKLHRTYMADREELLIYHANYLVNDFYVNLTLKENFEANDTVVITIRKNNTTTAYTYTAVTTTPSSNQFKIGLIPTTTIINLAALIDTNSSTTGLTAIAEGQTAKITGKSTDVDFTVESEASSVDFETVPAYSNIDSSITARIFKLMEAEQFDYLAMDPGAEISDVIRTGYERKAVRLREDALERFQILTV